MRFLDAVASHEFCHSNRSRHSSVTQNLLERSSVACSEQREVDVSYVLFCIFSYMLQKPQGNHNGIKSDIYQVLRLISVMYFCTISS